MRFHIPIKPLSANMLWQGRRFKTPKYKQYAQDVAYLLPKVQMIKGYVDVHFRFFLKNWKITDVNNLVKGLEDILVSCGYIEDDRYIMKSINEKIPSKEDFIEVEVEKRKIKEKK